MACTPVDRDLLDRLLSGDRDAWPAFVDRFLGLFGHVVSHTASCRGVHLTPADREDLIADVMVVIIKDDLRVLRRFERRSSLATYLAVIARRVIVKRLLARTGATPLGQVAHALPESVANGEPSVEQRVEDHDEVDQMLGGLPDEEARVIRMFHLEGRSYGEISQAIGVPENTIGPVLSRARSRIRRRAQGHDAAEV
ncbi:MAG: sigma-70 family RNA polymerase sigma factor [Planctomycetota bacterium]